MSVRALGADGDWTFGQGLQNYLTGPAEVAQDVATALKIFLGECFFDTAAGVDWWNLLGGRDASAVVLQCRRVISGRPNVTRIVSVVPVLDASTRGLRVQYRIATVYSLQAVNAVAVPVPSS